MKYYFAVPLVFALVSCLNNGMNNENEAVYLTVTYHSEGHTSGDVPVDPKHYIVPYWDGPTLRYENAIILGPGTLEKEGCVFEGWRHINPNGGYYSAEGPTWSRTFYYEGDIKPVGENMGFEASWWTDN